MVMRSTTVKNRRAIIQTSKESLFKAKIANVLPENQKAQSLQNWNQELYNIDKQLAYLSFTKIGSSYLRPTKIFDKKET